MRASSLRAFFRIRPSFFVFAVAFCALGFATAAAALVATTTTLVATPTASTYGQSVSFEKPS